MADLSSWIYGAWIVALTFWAIAAFASKRTIRSVSHLRAGLLSAAGFLLLLDPNIRPGSLGRRVLPASTLLSSAGLGLTVLGLGFMVWSRIALGRNWSASVTIKQDHELVRSGPYAIVRHPLYAGLLLAMLGTALFVGEARSFIGCALTFAGFRLKSLTEETLMLQQFGAHYAQYQQQVKALIPGLL